MESLGLVMADVSHGGRGQVKLQYTMGEMVCKAVRQLKESTQQSGQSISVALISDFVATVAMQRPPLS